MTQEGKPMSQKRTREVNEIGIGMAGLAGDRIKDICVFVEGGSVVLWVEIDDRSGISEFIQYFDPASAMAFSKAFERCAVAALKQSS
jgi:hypothetical protein